MTSPNTARALMSAARWLQRRAKKRSTDETKAAYKEAVEMITRLCPKEAKPKKSAPKKADTKEQAQ